jgi:hypothetical protein
MVCHLLTPGLELWQYSEKAVGAGEQDAGSSDSPKKDSHEISRDQLILEYQAMVMS